MLIRSGLFFCVLTQWRVLMAAWAGRLRATWGLHHLGSPVRLRLC